MSNKIVFMGMMAGLLAGACISGANAQNVSSATATAKARTVSANKTKADAVLFKIHDISSIKNTEGDVVACDFKVTFFNRSPKDINGATVLLSWKDKVIGDVIDGELRASAEKNKMNDDGRYVRATSATERVTPRDVNVSVDMPAIKSYKQLTLGAKLQSDRCFLLLNDVDFKVSSCTAIDNTPSTSGFGGFGGGSNNCAGLFKFVSAKDPAYYKEFKKISYDEEKEVKKTAYQKDMQEIDKSYGEAVEALNSASTTLSRIK